MSSFRGGNLFGSGPHRFDVHGRSQRHQLDQAPAADGATVTALGRTARRVDQSGELRADDVAGLEAQAAAIEAAADGVAGVLIDDLGRAWPAMVLVTFERGRARRVGGRLVMDYSAAYVQVGR